MKIGQLYILNDLFNKPSKTLKRANIPISIPSGLSVRGIKNAIANKQIKLIIEGDFNMIFFMKNN